MYQVHAKGKEVGAVSQSSDAPTGAIIETGINANGRYARFADPGGQLRRGHE